MCEQKNFMEETDEVGGNVSALSSNKQAHILVHNEEEEKGEEKHFPS